MLNLSKSQARICRRRSRAQCMSERQTKRERIIQRQRAPGGKRAAVGMGRVSEKSDARCRQPGGQGGSRVVGEQAHTGCELGEALDDRVPVLVSFPKGLDVAGLVPGNGLLEFLASSRVLVGTHRSILTFTELGSKEGIFRSPPVDSIEWKVGDFSLYQGGSKCRSYKHLAGKLQVIVREERLPDFRSDTISGNQNVAMGLGAILKKQHGFLFTRLGSDHSLVEMNGGSVDMGEERSVQMAAMEPGGLVALIRHICVRVDGNNLIRLPMPKDLGNSAGASEAKIVTQCVMYPQPFQCTHTIWTQSNACADFNKFWRLFIYLDSKVWYAGNTSE